MVNIDCASLGVVTMLEDNQITLHERSMLWLSSSSKLVKQRVSENESPLSLGGTDRVHTRKSPGFFGEI